MAVVVMLKTGWNCEGQTDGEDCLLQHIFEVNMNSYIAKNLNPFIKNPEVKISCNTVNDNGLANLWQWCGEMPINK